MCQKDERLEHSMVKWWWLGNVWSKWECWAGHVWCSWAAKYLSHWVPLGQETPAVGRNCWNQRWKICQRQSSLIWLLCQVLLLPIKISLCCLLILPKPSTSPLSASHQECCSFPLHLRGTQHVWPHNVIITCSSTYLPPNHEFLICKEWVLFISIISMPGTVSSTQAAIRILWCRIPLLPNRQR